YTEGGEHLRAGAAGDRIGFSPVLDRTNGKFIGGLPCVDKSTWATGLDEDGRPSYDEARRAGVPGGEAKGRLVFVVPACLGAKNWLPMDYIQDRGMFYVPSKEGGMDIWDEGIAEKKGAAFLGAGFTIKPLNE
ncbi:PQQ-dependent dehydrogenase, methanol/ethanol family, partial [Pseudomonas ogarae]